MFATKGQDLGSPLAHRSETPVAGSNLRAFRQLFKTDDEKSTEPDNYPGFKRSDELVKSCQVIRNRICEEITLLEKQIRMSKATRLKKSLPNLTDSDGDSNINKASRLASVSVHSNLNQKTMILDSTEVRRSEGAGEIVQKIKRPVGRPPKKRPAEVSLDGGEPAASEYLDQKFIGFSPESELHKTCKKRLEAINREILAEDTFIGFPLEDPLHRACLQRLEKIKHEVDLATGFEGFNEDDPLKIQCLEKYKSITSEISDIIGMLKSGQSVYKLPEFPVQVKRTQEDLDIQASDLDTNCTSTMHKVNVNSTLRSIPETSRLVRVLHPNDKKNIDKMKHGPRVKPVRFRGGPGQALPVDKFLPDQYPWDQKYDDYGNNVQGRIRSPPAPIWQSSTVIPTELAVAQEDILLGRRRCVSTPGALIKAILPCSVQHVNSNGFAVVVTQTTPPRPLCFLCGSAGIDQLVFCSTCCEPYHPFCVGDTALALTFVRLKEEIHTTPAHTETEKPGDDDVTELLSRWKCNRCWSCASCGGARNCDTMKDQLQFFKCKNCRNTFHTACAGKWYSGIFSGANLEDGESVNWLCDNCVKCKSCGVKLENLGLDKKYARKKLFESSMLCLECFKQIQKGSYCPVCNSSYDDNDYDTRMMECAKCQRWVHATCENVSEEQYQVLSHLPDCVEFVCRMCDETDGHPLWKQAINVEITTGCEAAVRIFFKALVEESRKRRKLTFDIPEDEELHQAKNLQLMGSPPAKKGKLIQHANANIMHNVDSIPGSTHSAVTPVNNQENSVSEVTIQTPGSTVPSVSSVNDRSQSSRVSVKGSKSCIEVYETSDGSFVNIQDCQVYVRDVLKHPTGEISKLLSVNKQVFCSKYEAAVKTMEFESCISSPELVLKNTPKSNNTQSRSLLPKSPASADVLKSLERSWMNKPAQNDSENGKSFSHLTPPWFSCEERMNTPKKVSSPLKKVGHFIEALKDNPRLQLCFSVSKFFAVLSDALSDFFEVEDSPQRVKWQEEIKSALKEVFPWLNEELLSCDIQYDTCKSNASPEDLHKNILCVNPFRPVAWDDTDESDGRICEFCGDRGDFRADDRGRLLWAGINVWIHVNCALWSSEIWEEESGALQQVSQALARSKNLVCKLCGNKGASVSCCHSQCKQSYHFHCAVKSGCAMNEDKSVFCKSHNVRRDRIQNEFHVQRRVFVDLEWIRKKEKPVESGDIKVFIGALRIDALGELNARSVSLLSDDIDECKERTCLLPSEFRCSRIYWSIQDPLRMQLYTISTAVDGPVDINTKCHRNIKEFNTVIDHADRSSKREKSERAVLEFHNWLRNAPAYIDEHDVEWIPQYPGGLHTIAPITDSVHTQSKRKEIHMHVEANGALVSSFRFQDYMAVYLRLKHLRNLLDQQLSLESKQCSRAVNAGSVRIPLSPIKQLNHLTVQAGPAENKAKLTANILHEKAKNNPEFCRKLFLCMVDGAVDSSSDASSPSGSSVTGTSEEDSNENLESANISSSDSEDNQRTSQRVTRSRFKEASPALHRNPPRRRDANYQVRQIPNKYQKRMTEHICEKCHSKFGSPAGLSRHKRWCGDTNKASDSTTFLKPVMCVRRRTRNSANTPGRSEDQVECGSVTTIGDATVIRSNSGSCSARRKKKSKTPSSENDNVHERNPGSENPKVNKALLAPKTPAEEDPTTCETCGLTYRTHGSYVRHLENCFPDSSSEASAVNESESDNDSSETINNGSNNETAAPASSDDVCYAGTDLLYARNHGLLSFSTANEVPFNQASMVQAGNIMPSTASSHSPQSADVILPTSDPGSAGSVEIENGVMTNVNGLMGVNMLPSINFASSTQGYSQEQPENVIQNIQSNFVPPIQTPEETDQAGCHTVYVQQPVDASTSIYSTAMLPQQDCSSSFPTQCGPGMGAMMELTKLHGSNYSNLQGDWGDYSNMINSSLAQPQSYAASIPAYQMFENFSLRSLKQDCYAPGLPPNYSEMNSNRSTAGSTVYYTSSMNLATAGMHPQDCESRPSYSNVPNIYGGYDVNMGPTSTSIPDTVIIRPIEDSTSGFTVRRVACAEPPSFGMPLEMKNSMSVTPAPNNSVLMYPTSGNLTQQGVIEVHETEGGYVDANTMASSVRANVTINPTVSSFNSASPEETPYIRNPSAQNPCFVPSTNSNQTASFLRTSHGPPLRYGSLLNQDQRVQHSHNHSCCDPMSTRQLSPVRDPRLQLGGATILSLPMEVPLNPVKSEQVPQTMIHCNYGTPVPYAAEHTAPEPQAAPVVQQMSPSFDLPSNGLYANSEPVIMDRSDGDTLNRRIAAGRLNHQSSNVAVVRPLENPLQRMSNQISQLEINIAGIPCPPLLPAGVSSFSDVKSTLVSHEISKSCPTTLRPIKPITPKYVEVRTEDVIQSVNSLRQKRDEIEESAMPTAENVNQDRNPLSARNSCSSTRKPSTESLPPSFPVDSFKLKLNVHHQEGSDHYTVKNIAELASKAKGAMTGLKIRAKVMGGEEGITTCVRVEPALETVSIKREIVSENEIQQNDEKKKSVVTADQNGSQATAGVSTRLVRRAVIVYEVKSGNEILFRSSNVQKVWGYIFEKVQGARENLNLAPLPFPGTSKLIRGSGAGRAECLQMLGVTHQAVQFLLEQLPGKESVIDKHKFVFHEPGKDDVPLPVNHSGCARCEPFTFRKPFDMFGWLASKHRIIPRLEECLSEWSQQDLPIAMRYRNLREKPTVSLGVYYSAIHGRGLFTRREIQEGEMIIEYAGELIRTVLSDLRERYYESKGIGCYFFTIDEKIIIDATMKGNAARFINHSCEPNCKSKAVDILGKKHILIFAERRIFAGEELTYDYKFALEDYDKKIPCSCGARKCRKYLN